MPYAGGNEMRRTKLEAALAILLALTVLLQGVQQASASDTKPGSSLTQYTVETITTEFRRLDPFVSSGDGKQVLDIEEAKKAGFSDTILALAGEVIDYQNEVREIAQQGEKADVRQIDIPVTGYPLLTEFEAMLSRYQPVDQGATRAPDTHACGTYAHPVPNYTPPRPPMGWYPNAHNTLLSWGFHQTAGYACGGDPFVPCERDYTRGRGYSSQYGYCDSPRFRDHGTRDAANHDIWIQYGEPNPEIFSYGWPYWDWGWYAEWWHDTY